MRTPLPMPGFTLRRFDVENPNAEKLAAWMLALVDESPDKLAIIRMPPHRDDDELDEIEARFIAGYDIAKAQRPNLSVKLLRAVEFVDGGERDRIAVAVHEHKWVAGQCVNGCPDSRPTTAEEN